MEDAGRVERSDTGVPDIGTRWFHANGIDIRARVWHPDSPMFPPLLILHGIWETWRTFASVAPRLARHRVVYALDLRGHGESSRPPSGYRIADYAADVRDVIACITEERVDLLGHSLGSTVALEIGRSDPGRVAHLVLEDPPFILPEEEDDNRERWRQVLELKHAPRETVISALSLAYPPSFGEAWIQESARTLIDTADGPFLVLVNGEQSLSDWSDFTQVEVPTLILAADPLEGGFLMGRRRSGLAVALPQARILDVPESSHHIQTCFPDLYVDLVERFLSDQSV